MQREVWATYSVKDHLQDRAFIADVMLYDRLVFPVPQRFMPFSSLSGIPRQVLERDPVEWARWEEPDKQWDPARQNLLLKILGDLAMPVPWGGQPHEQWETAWQQLDEVAKQARETAFQLTQSLLMDRVPAYVEGVAVSGVSYPSLDDLKRELPYQTELRSVPGGTLHAVLGHEFVVVDDPHRSYEYQLEVAIELSLDPVFQAKRRALREWEQGFLRDGNTDAPSIARAVEEMRDLIAEERAALPKTGLQTGMRWGYRISKVVAPAAFGAVAAHVRLPPEAGGMAAEAFLQFVEVAGGKDLTGEPQAGQPAPAAFFISAEQVSA